MVPRVLSVLGMVLRVLYALDYLLQLLKLYCDGFQIHRSLMTIVAYRLSYRLDAGSYLKKERCNASARGQNAYNFSHTSLMTFQYRMGMTVLLMRRKSKGYLKIELLITWGKFAFGPEAHLCPPVSGDEITR